MLISLFVIEDGAGSPRGLCCLLDAWASDAEGLTFLRIFQRMAQDSTETSQMKVDYVCSRLLGNVSVERGLGVSLETSADQILRM